MKLKADFINAKHESYIKIIYLKTPFLMCCIIYQVMLFFVFCFVFLFFLNWVLFVLHGCLGQILGNTPDLLKTF